MFHFVKGDRCFLWEWEKEKEDKCPLFLDLYLSLLIFIDLYLSLFIFCFIFPPWTLFAAGALFLSIR